MSLLILKADMESRMNKIAANSGEYSSRDITPLIENYERVLNLLYTFPVEDEDKARMEARIVELETALNEQHTRHGETCEELRKALDEVVYLRERNTEHRRLLVQRFNAIEALEKDKALLDNMQEQVRRIHATGQHLAEISFYVSDAPNAGTIRDLASIFPLQPLSPE